MLNVILGNFLVAVAYQWFFGPHHLVSGGVGGVALLLWQIFGWSTGLQVLVYNIPILLWGQKYLGRKFLLLTVLGIVSLSGILAVLPVQAVIPDDQMLNAIFGGIVLGAGTGLAIRSGGSTGGLDVLAVALNRRYSIPAGDVMLAVNAVIVSLAGLHNDLKVVLYTLIAMFVSGKMVDAVTAATSKKTILVVTDKAEQIARRVNEEMVRGVTILDATGAYSGAPRKILLCTVTRYELAQCKEIVAAVDPGAFLVVLSTDEVFGRFHGYSLLKRARGSTT
ncbi:MAG TPA: YitT family protein [Symbiobacteriaceae bacterium]